MKKTVTTVRLGTPNARQREFFMADIFLSLGGARGVRGGGKSGRCSVTILMSAYCGGIKILIVRRTLRNCGKIIFCR